jgi:urea carboxylase
LGLDTQIFDEGDGSGGEDENIPQGFEPVHASAMGTVWKVEAAEGDHVEAGQTLVIIESMKMEMALVAPHAGRLAELRCQPGRVVKAGQIIALIESRV